MSFQIDPKRWQKVVQLMEKQIAERHFPAISVRAGLVDGQEVHYAGGSFDPNNPADARQINEDTTFLIASITKPVTVCAVMMLVERGLVGLDDPVSAFIPAFQGKHKDRIRIRHLMCHTSGLPDMLPENDNLRASGATFSRFVEEICRCEILFEAGTQVRYQSMGTALLGEIVHQVSGQSLSDFMKTEIFEPLGMQNSQLGVMGKDCEANARIQLDPAKLATNWHWNSPYWLGFGAPWGGMTSNTRDLCKLARVFLHGGSSGRVRILGDTATGMMTTSQMDSFAELSADDRRTKTWGFGWRVVGANVNTYLGGLLPSQAFGHYGATGTIMWMDPIRGAYAVILTNRPYDETQAVMTRLSNAVSAAIVSQ